MPDKKIMAPITARVGTAAAKTRNAIGGGWAGRN